ncbi:hypothetical protein [Streptomyces sp. NBC_01262]|uniref:hypothetical protein n=1 Tax=Streptomyces sp. NBC_01262 TaxID=2903803 RepID=UPI002E37B5A8|nr:hypothetical protein [Streptomyces sp. NBC_01262]
MRLLRGAAMGASALLIAVLVVIGLLTRSSWSGIRNHSAPQITSATGLYFAINDMDAQLANQLMFGTNPELADDRRTAAKIYDQRRDQAGVYLRDLSVAAQGDPVAGASIAQAIADFGSYEEGAAHALLLSKQAAHPAGQTDADTLAAYRSATEVMRTRLLPEADQLVTANNVSFNTTYTGTTDNLSSARIAVLAAGLLLVVVLVVLHLFLTFRFRRILNPAVAVAVLIALGVSIAASVQISAQQEYLHGARRDAYDSVVALTRARAVAYDANADESRYLLDQPLAAEHEQHFFDKTQQLMHLPGAAIRDWDARADAAMNAYRANQEDLPFTGFFGDEFRNITFRGERKQAEAVMARYQVYQKDDRRIRALASSGDVTGAIAFCVSYAPGDSNWAFGEFDTALQKLIAINTSAYEKSSSEGAGSALTGPLGLSGAVVVIAVLAFIGLRRHLAEFPPFGRESA